LFEKEERSTDNSNCNLVTEIKGADEHLLYNNMDFYVQIKVPQHIAFLYTTSTFSFVSKVSFPYCTIGA